MESPPRVLLVDSYDSFTYNLARLLRRAIPNVALHIVKNDELSIAQLLPHLASFSALVIGPGPGSPDRPADVGLIQHIWTLPDAHLLPVFGVCLGLQSLCIAFGGELKALDVVRHGRVWSIDHNGTDLFQGVGAVEAVRYHSLHVDPRAAAHAIEPLAWADDGMENGMVLMAARHRTKPFWGVQYHPESICTNDAGAQVVANFWKLASVWSESTGREIVPLSADWHTSATGTTGTAFVPPLLSPSLSSLSSSPSLPANPVDAELTPGLARNVQVSTLTLPHLAHTLPIPRLCELMGVENPGAAARTTDVEFALLDSAAAPGRFSIIGLVFPETLRITYRVGDASVKLRRGADEGGEEVGMAIWRWLAEFMHRRRATGGAPESPFWGGLVGLFTYEAGVASLGIDPRPFLTPHAPTSAHAHAPGRGPPDVNLAFVERSIVVDTQTGTVWVQSLREDDGISQPQSDSKSKFGSRFRTQIKPIVQMPDKEEYIAKIKRAQEYLAAGESYELCLTAQTRIRLPSPQIHTPANPKAGNVGGAGGVGRRTSAWTLFKALRARNPAPYATYLRLSGTTLVGSSPERFLSWTRTAPQRCQLRPIKGTVKKPPPSSSLPPMTLERASALLNTPKERAENLMIVDLIRHDLHRLAGDSVEVTKLFGVEEYETVFQLVSVVEGCVPVRGGYSGVDVLARSLPPGDMTGAPKKRSVEILQTLEGAERRVYSGICGYWCAGGAGDFSIVIRSAYRFDDEDDSGANANASATTCAGYDTWYVGAGGAITALSDPQDEWDEMETKLRSTLQTFLAL
ncbi:hypothetical protein BOTBODRAFT_163733 [Botryobasidium botryosum FD-172 SS1]|uniref:aminodeoxychorismate synthase n=1 Tax=Botryobasidium botryosum (strain FD-172 SS1) TaxID=930990 RepID=A0A067M3V4_BOTB1|nr:hypothetical protein BOTBODRAFT_163733 [Botryobasidium botryosum FD-172 SS1]